MFEMNYEKGDFTLPLESSLESHSSGYRRPGKKLNPLRAKIAEKKE